MKTFRYDFVALTGTTLCREKGVGVLCRVGLEL